MPNVIEFLKQAKAAYYAGEPIISDVQYDNLEEHYREGTQVGYSISDGLPHYSRLYSLDKKYRGEDELPGDLSKYVRTPKLDGASVALLYVDGGFVQALTRGDGKMGKDVTPLVRSLVPPIIYMCGDTGVRQVRGEIVAPKSIENARNYAAGALGLKDSEEFNKRTLFFVAHEVSPPKEDCYTADMLLLSDLFMTVGTGNSFSEFPQDGEVYRYEKHSDYYAAGFTSKHPKGAFALKDRTEGVETTLLDVQWSTGKSGKVTPVAILEPIKIEDAVVSRATLNNPGFIESLGLKLGDKVMVERAGGIIPRIIGKAG